MFRLQRNHLCQANWQWAHIVLVIFRGASAGLTVCNTVAGTRKDVSKVSHDVSENANEYK
jgi:predicted small secreted protein